MNYHDKNQGFAFQFPNGQSFRCFNGTITKCKPLKGNS